ncbi:MAG: PhnD/SsuA/transferrin family substrate-binding protein [Anaerolineales bacterium]|nr:PhnD/SsuA/transferrin family substrate-binding protein [Anaerolineales bacterium]
MKQRPRATPQRNPITWFWLTSLTLLAVACGPQIEIVPVTREVEIEVTRPILLEATVLVTQPVPVTVEVPLEVTRLVEVNSAALVPGTAERPYQLFFLPSTNPRVAEVRGQFMLDALREATGYEFVGVVPEDDTAVLDALCNQTQDTIAILDPTHYLQAEETCNAQLSLGATRFDVPYQLGMVVVPTGSDIETLADLNGKTIAVPSRDDLATYQTILGDNGIEAEIIETGTSSAALLALLAGEVDAATAVYNPPILPFNERIWDYDTDDPEIWRATGRTPTRNPIGYVDVLTTPERGGYRIRDARAAIFDTHPEVFDETRIIALSPRIPQEAIVFGRDFSLSAADQVSRELLAFTTSEACAQSVCASDFYQWTGTAPVMPSAYNILRLTPPVEEN